jgi:hypothetical protein
MTDARIDRASLGSLRILLNGIQDQAPKILTRSLNRTAQKARTDGSREVRKQVNLKAAYVKDRLKIRKASFRNLQAGVSTPIRGLLLSRFSTNRQISGDSVSWIRPPQVPARGIKVKVDPSSGAKVVTGGSDTKGKPFYLILPGSGRVAIASRRRTTGPKGGKLKVLYGPSLSQVFDDVIADISGPLNEFLSDEVDKNIDTALRGF